MDAHKKMIQQDWEGKYRKYQYKRVREDTYHQKNMSVWTSAVEVLCDWKMDQISSIKIPQLKNILCFQYGSEKYKGKSKAFIVEIAKVNFME